MQFELVHAVDFFALQSNTVDGLQTDGDGDGEHGAQTKDQLGAELESLKKMQKYVHGVAVSSMIGRLRLTRLPCPSWLWIVMVPRCRLTISFTMLMPSPVPGTLPEASAR